MEFEETVGVKAIQFRQEGKKRGLILTPDTKGLKYHLDLNLGEIVIEAKPEKLRELLILAREYALNDIRGEHNAILGLVNPEERLKRKEMHFLRAKNHNDRERGNTIRYLLDKNGYNMDAIDGDEQSIPRPRNISWNGWTYTPKSNTSLVPIIEHSNGKGRDISYVTLHPYSDLGQEHDVLHLEIPPKNGGISRQSYSLDFFSEKGILEGITKEESIELAEKILSIISLKKNQNNSNYEAIQEKLSESLIGLGNLETKLRQRYGNSYRAPN
ncbi:hypothetical protein KY366_05545 [Candidatus Woesearchaeota archaeon]|nr:hypothetical protein [Candidatus Woesearchaeota archaeon]